MFSKLFKRKKKEEPEENKEDTFSINKMEEDGKTFLLRFKERQWKYADSGNYPFQIGIATPLNTDNNGFLQKKRMSNFLTWNKF